MNQDSSKILALTDFFGITPNNQEKITVLIVGGAKVGKTFIASQLDTISRGKIHLRETRSLPLEENITRPRIDYVIFVCDLTNRFSMEDFKQWISFISAEYLSTGRSCVVVTGVERRTDHHISMANWAEVLVKINLQAFYLNLNDDQETRLACERIWKHISLLLPSSSLLNPILTQL